MNAYRRFLPYFKYFKPVKAALIGGILCGLLFGAATGFGLPVMVKYVFPKVFPDSQVGTRVIALYDADRNGTIDGAEIDTLRSAFAAKPKADLRHFDSNKDNALSDEEISAIKMSGPEGATAEARKIGKLELIGIALWLPTVFLIRGVAGYCNSYLIQYCGVRVLEALRLDYFRKLQALPLAFFQRNSTGDLISRGLGDTNQLQNTLTTVANEIVKQPASLISALTLLVYLAFTEHGVVMVLITLLLVPASVFPVRYVGKKMLHKAQQLQSQAGSITDRFTENLAAVKEVRAFGLEKAEATRFAESSQSMVRVQMKVAKYAQLLTPAIEVISSVGISITFIYAYQVQIPLGSFLAIITALYASYDPIKKLGALNSEITRGRVSLARLEEVLNEPLSITDPAKPVPVSRLKGDISFEHVSFAYKESPVLREISIDIPAGTVCALVGPSGAGKSTFANLVPRFYDVTHGAVKIDSIDLRQMRVADLRGNISIVFQDPILFNETVYNNILVGRMDATKEEVEQAARNAFAHDFIEELLPEGYNTIVGERGSRLSGGQRQRIALARAFLRNAPILILDEATSALDSESEAAIQVALKKLIAGKTVLIIAHRFSTIRDATLVLVFEEGKILTAGDHTTLYRNSQLYKNLYDQQTIAGTPMREVLA